MGPQKEQKQGRDKSAPPRRKHKASPLVTARHNARRAARRALLADPSRRAVRRMQIVERALATAGLTQHTLDIALYINNRPTNKLKRSALRLARRMEAANANAN